MQSAEVELKFPVQNIATLEARLPTLGFQLLTPRTFEQNTLFDTPTRSLRDQHQILRIRQYGPVYTLTHKRPPANCDDSRYKTRIESETSVEDGPTLAAIFHELGLEPVFRYEKFRSEYRDPSLAHGHLVIDETPIGTWAELEGPIEWIDQRLADLAIDRADCLTDSYGTLFLKWKQKTASPAGNLTFAEITPELAAH